MPQETQTRTQTRVGRQHRRQIDGIDGIDGSAIERRRRAMYVPPMGAGAGTVARPRTFASVDPRLIGGQ